MTTYNCNGILLNFEQPKVMGIINITPDSFYSASRKEDIKEVLCTIESMVTDGVDIIDVGAMSSRPGAKVISSKDEKQRLIPILLEVKKTFPDVIVSIDTFRAEIAYEVMDIGANIINDISGGDLDNRMFNVVSKFPVPYILMHMRGNSTNMQEHTLYKDLILEMIQYFNHRINQLKDLGKNEIILDPGFGFAKSLDDNYKLLNNLSVFKLSDLPVLVGLSRKSMIYRMLGISPEESLSSTSALHLQALFNGAKILRTHDVKEAIQVVKLFEKMNQVKIQLN